MKRERFISERRSDWQRFEVLLRKLKGSRRRKCTTAEIGELTRIYRSICYDLSMTRSREWGSQLEQYLNHLVAQGNTFIYRAPPRSIRLAFDFLAVGFPRLLRKHAWFFWLGMLLFFGPFFVTAAIATFNPSATSWLLPAEQIEQMESMYSESRGVGGVDADYANERAYMTGFYVWNNVGIAFRCFAMGVLLGVGTVVVMFVNGLVIGTVFGFFMEKLVSGSNVLAADNFFSFVITHGSFELTAIAIAGGAGMLLGWGILHPGNMSRMDSIRYHGLDAIKLATGAGVMLCIAALIEAFFSPMPIHSGIKYVVGTLAWILVFAYLGLAGRRGQFEESVSTPTGVNA